MNMGDLPSSDRSSNFFLHKLKVSSYRSLVCLVRVISRYFILFVAIMKGSISLITIAHILFVFKRVTNFQLILYLAMSLKVFYQLQPFPDNIFVSDYILSASTIIISANSNAILTQFFEFVFSQSSFCCLITLAINSSTDIRYHFCIL